MTTVLYPSVRLSANGATALLDTVDHGVRVCDLPGGAVRRDLGDDHDLSHLSLSASGNAVAWVEEDGHVAILTAAGRTRTDLSVSRARIRAIAISDTGERVAVLIATDAQDAGEGSEGKLIVIHRQAAGDRPAETEMPVYDSGSILANDDCSLLAVRSFSRVFEQDDSRAFVRDGSALKPLWTEHTRPAAHGALALYGDWLFAATPDGLAGWHRSGKQGTLPGSMRERMIFSPQGSHLLTYRTEEVIEVTFAHTLFRLIDLTSLREVRRAHHLIAECQAAQFALDVGLSLVDVWATSAGKLAVKQLAWNDSAILPR